MEHQTQIKNLQRETQHYQTLYQKRVERDITADQNLTLYQQKVEDLENQLISLAKQKLKGKKEASELVEKLERNWTEKEREWEKEKENYQLDQESWEAELIKNKEKIRKLEKKKLAEREEYLKQCTKIHEKLRKDLDNDKFQLTRRLEQAQEELKKSQKIKYDFLRKIDNFIENN